jgi:hypothetical protein
VNHHENEKKKRKKEVNSEEELQQPVSNCEPSSQPSDNSWANKRNHSREPCDHRGSSEPHVPEWQHIPGECNDHADEKHDHTNTSSSPQHCSLHDQASEHMSEHHREEERCSVEVNCLNQESSSPVDNHQLQ